jgi:hypothetical protein
MPFLTIHGFSTQITKQHMEPTLSTFKPVNEKLLQVTSEYTLAVVDVILIQVSNEGKRI